MPPMAFGAGLNVLQARERTRRARSACRMSQEKTSAEAQTEKLWYTRRKRDRWSESDLGRLPDDLRPLHMETLDLILRKKVLLLQSRRGYRANTDSQVLAYFASRRRRKASSAHDGIVPTMHQGLDLGAGNGLVSILYGLGNSSAQLNLLELQDSLADRAIRNLRLNNLETRCSVQKHDLGSGLPANLKGRYDVVLCNPPFYKDISQRSPPTRKEKLLAHFVSSASLLDFAQAAYLALNSCSSSSAFFIHDAKHTEELTTSIQEAGLNIAAMQTVYHRVEQEPLRTLVEANIAKSGNSAVNVLKPLVLHPEGTSETEYGEDMEEFLASLPFPPWKIGQLRDDYLPETD
mmetsp:Transcript_11227/g.34386  ORF Transcript_11227/g.34386 Transcript_11227/m.34386 type:complete len:348 (-) Transcript_11227:1003-2046(-)